MGKKNQDRGKMVPVFILIVVSVVLIATALLMLTTYKNEITERSSSAAKYNTLLVRNALEENLDSYTLKAMSIANQVSSLTLDEATIYLDNSIEQGVKGIKFCRYFDQNGVLHSTTKAVYELDEDLAIAYRAKNPNKAGYIGIFNDSTVVDSGSMSVIGFYAPVEDSTSISGIVTYYTRQALVELNKEIEKSEDVELSTICTTTTDGNIIAGISTTEGAGMRVYLRENLNILKEDVDRAMSYVESGTVGVVFCSIDGEDCLLSISGNKDEVNDLVIVELYKVSVLYKTTLDFVQAIIAVVIVFSIIIAGVVFFLVLNDYRLKKTIFNMETNDVLLDCLNRHGFEKEAKKILDTNPNSYFTIIYMTTRHFKHLLETLSESEINSLLRFLKVTLSKTIQVEEIYAHVEGGDFLILLHAKDRKALIERLKLHSFLAKQYKGASTFDVLIRYGIYEYQKDDSISISQMIDFANEANRTVVTATAENAGMKFNFYSDELRQIRILNDNMELRMEGALHDGEFQIFYQPKYNLNSNKQDGCEALVRWYDAKTDEYNRPALFMKLFETNGFVVKLDKYVYTKVCEYISYSIANGRPVFPVSVNISRVTAIQTDFVEYYTKIKKKFNIPNGLIMIEFTESFAYENYETLLGIVDKLHQNGFKCSIDDFGCGYSSYKILKSLPMDEIKLDKFFLEKGITQERDRTILESVIKLAKSLNMKVTQEGVEIPEELAIIRELGCDVVQGYYYAHPMGLNDYLNFVAHQNEHKI